MGARLIEYDGNRENNFTLIRIILAWLVLYGHSYAIQKTPGVVSPLFWIFKGSTYSGEIAISSFFALSGFLVTASLMKRGFKDYAIARVLRIFPALILCILVSVFILGPILTNLSIVSYFTNIKT